MSVSWTTFHLHPADLDARAELVAQRLPMLHHASWFFADVPVERHGHMAHVVEVAVRQLAGRSLDRWLADLLVDGVVVAAEQVDRPHTLSAHLFPGGTPPSSYLDLLMATSTRAAALATRTVGASVVVDEVVELYRSLVPGDDRRFVLEQHMTWLVRALGGPVPRDVSDVAHAAAAPAPWGEGVYARLRPALDADVARIAGSSPDVSSDPRVVRASLVARLAHVQIVRLLGPLGGRRTLRWEADVIRTLADV